MKYFSGLLCFWFTLLVAAAVEMVGPINVATTASTATVTWQTDVSAGTRIQITPNIGAVTIPDKAPDVRHAATLENLNPGTKYTVLVGTARAWLGSTTFTTAGTAPTAPVSPNEARGDPSPGASTAEAAKPSAPPARQTWGNPASLQDHFERHGADFKAKNPEDYARLAWEFLQRARAGAYRTKLDDDGVLRVFDPKTRAFAAYNRNGTTKTFFKPDSRDYFERQPGREINLAERK